MIHLTYSEYLVLFDVVQADAQIRISDKNLWHEVLCDWVHQRPIAGLALQNSVVNKFRVAVMEWSNSEQLAAKITRWLVRKWGPPRTTRQLRNCARFPWLPQEQCRREFRNLYMFSYLLLVSAQATWRIQSLSAWCVHPLLSWCSLALDLCILYWPHLHIRVSKEAYCAGTKVHKWSQRCRRWGLLVYWSRSCSWSGWATLRPTSTPWAGTGLSHLGTKHAIWLQSNFSVAATALSPS